MYAHSRAPVRIGIAGGGTDLPAWTKERPGECLSLAIASYTHVVAITRPDKMVVASYRQRDVAAAATEIANGLIRESALMHGWEDGFEVHTLSELSSKGTGLGVSSSIAVALAACFRRMSYERDNSGKESKYQDFRYRALEGGDVKAVSNGDSFVWEKDLDFYTRIAKDAWIVEIDRLRRPIGRQDHMAAAHGGLRLYRFESETATVKQSFIREDAEWLAKHLLLVKLPDGHDSRSILQSINNIDMIHSSLMTEAVPLAIKAIQLRDPKELGKVLVYGHGAKCMIPGAVPDWLKEAITSITLCKGVFGCKVTGAGGGGHIVIATDGDCRTQERLRDLTKLPVIEVIPDFSGVRSEAWP